LAIIKGMKKETSCNFCVNNNNFHTSQCWNNCPLWKHCSDKNCIFCRDNYNEIFNNCQHSMTALLTYKGASGHESKQRKQESTKNAVFNTELTPNKPVIPEKPKQEYLAPNSQKKNQFVGNIKYEGENAVKTQQKRMLHIPNDVLAKFKKAANNFVNVKNVYDWKKKLEESTGLTISLIEYSGSRRLWKRTELGKTPELACASLSGYDNVIIIPSTNAVNLKGSEISEWYIVNGISTNYIIDELALAECVEGKEFSKGEYGKGIISTS